MRGRVETPLPGPWGDAMELRDALSRECRQLPNGAIDAGEEPWSAAGHHLTTLSAGLEPWAADMQHL
jgi:hypothetical protein